MIEAMKQALEALECLFGIPEHLTGKGGGDVAVWRLGGSYRAQQAITSLRQAIAEAEKQEQGEPVAWMRQDGQRVTTASDRHNYPDYETRYSIPLYTHPQPKREWVGLTDEQVEKIIKDNMSLQMNLAGIRQDFEAAHGIKENTWKTKEQ